MSVDSICYRFKMPGAYAVRVNASAFPDVIDDEADWDLVKREYVRDAVSELCPAVKVEVPIASLVRAAGPPFARATASALTSLAYLCEKPFTVRQ